MPVPGQSGPPILYADARLVILNKPPGLKAHPGPSGGTSVEDWFPALSRQRRGPWLAHRLDADTAGCLAVALRKTALLEIQAKLAAGAAQKTYWAVVHGRPQAASGRIDAKLRKQTGPDGWRISVAPAGQAAVTDWRVLGADGDISWLELRPLTGRTHQIRVHWAALGCPILGDPQYGGGPGALHLLAHSLYLPLEPAASAVAPPPPRMQAALRRCGWA